jgi:hypothetical protein
MTLTNMTMGVHEPKGLMPSEDSGLDTSMMDCVGHANEDIFLNVAGPSDTLGVSFLTQSRRPRREYHLPKQFCDNLPELPVPTPVPTMHSSPEPHPIRRVILIIHDCLVTVMNSFGIWHDYPERPSADPDALLTLQDLSNSHHHHSLASQDLHSESGSHSYKPPSYWPFQVQQSMPSCNG